MSGLQQLFSIGWGLMSTLSAHQVYMHACLLLYASDGCFRSLLLTQLGLVGCADHVFSRLCSQAIRCLAQQVDGHG